MHFNLSTSELPGSVYPFLTLVKYSSNQNFNGVQHNLLFLATNSICTYNKNVLGGSWMIDGSFMGLNSPSDREFLCGVSMSVWVLSRYSPASYSPVIQLVGSR